MMQELWRESVGEFSAGEKVVLKLSQVQQFELTALSLREDSYSLS